MTNLVDLENIIIPYPASGWKSAFTYDSYKDAIEHVKQKMNNDYKKEVPFTKSIQFYYIRNNESNSNVPEFVVWRDLEKKNLKKNKYIDYAIIENPSNQYPHHYINQGNEAINQKFRNYEKSKIEILNIDHLNFHDTTWNDSILVIWAIIDPDTLVIKEKTLDMMNIPNTFKVGGKAERKKTKKRKKI